MPKFGESLITPSDPVDNGFDNIEGDLILKRGDIIGLCLNLIYGTFSGPQESEESTIPIPKYQIESVIGCGVFGQVLKCIDIKRNRTFAIKILKNDKKYFKQAQLERHFLRRVCFV
jgi:serine/threonine protein kinase